jgi:hypothetical protein
VPPDIQQLDDSKNCNIKDGEESMSVCFALQAAAAAA